MMTSDVNASGPGNRDNHSVHDDPNHDVTPEDLYEIASTMLRCAKCKSYVVGDGSTNEVPCSQSNCVNVNCAACGTRWAKIGPVECPCKNDPEEIDA